MMKDHYTIWLSCAPCEYIIVHLLPLPLRWGDLASPPGFSS